MSADFTPVDLALQFRSAPSNYAPHQVIGRPRSRTLSNPSHAASHLTASSAAAKAGVSVAPAAGLKRGSFFAKFAISGGTSVTSAAVAAVLAGGIASLAGPSHATLVNSRIAHSATLPRLKPVLTHLAAQSAGTPATLAAPPPRHAQPVNTSKSGPIAIPEPSSLAIFALGALTSLVASLRRRVGKEAVLF